MVALWSLLKGTPKWQEQLAAATATTSSVQKRKSNKPIVDEDNAVPTGIEAAMSCPALLARSRSRGWLRKILTWPPLRAARPSWPRRQSTRRFMISARQTRWS
uniref:Uncharacterized protein n=1 Tax=Hyaloperonospora arabidopsidis (strain Emoy2) TaxID=559515 RepID=M4BWT4_HYAAE